MNGSDPSNDNAIAADTSELATALHRGDLPIITTPDPLAPGDQCHFATPVRFGRRRSDQYGHVLLTSGWLKFRGTLDLSITWSEIADVQRVGREIVIALQDSRRLLRYSCHSEGEAARGVLIAQHLAQRARAHTADSPGTFEQQHAAL